MKKDYVQRIDHEMNRLPRFIPTEELDQLMAAIRTLDCPMRSRTPPQTLPFSPRKSMALRPTERLPSPALAP
ncbi:MAG: hypothetical protein ACREX4_14795 [Gammaproteobacteria bacterium]